jgi:hypothetical protein
MRLLGNRRWIPSGSAATRTVNLTDFGRPLRAGRSLVKRYAVSNNDGEIPLGISGIRFSNRAFTALSYPKYLFRGGSGVVRVRYRAPNSRRGGQTQTRMSILNNDPARPVYTATLRARYRPNWW